MGISLNKLNEMDMRCPVMNGTECMGEKCALWIWDNEGNPHYYYKLTDGDMSGEWMKDGPKDASGDQRWVHPPTGHCGLVKE